MASGIYLLPELLYDILSRLPAKSIGRFRCTCKQWQTLLSGRQFLELQFSQNKYLKKIILRCFSNNTSSFVSIEFLKDPKNNQEVVAIGKTLNFKLSGQANSYKICGSCQGLLLLVDVEKRKLAIANPITLESWQLPALPENVILCNVGCIGYGFGYDSNNDDYIVVIILSEGKTCQVYMLKRNCWKRVQITSPYFCSSAGVFVNGAFHWLGSRISNRSEVTFAFDLANETFRDVDLPVGLKAEDVRVVDEIGGCLCLVAEFRSPRVTEVWVMNTNEAKESWTKFSVYYWKKYFFNKALFFWNSFETMVVMDGKRLLLCNLKWGTSRKIVVQGKPLPEFFDHSVWTFTDSLCSPGYYVMH